MYHWAFDATNEPKFAEAVVIATPDALHAEPAIAFAKLGYPLLLSASNKRFLFELLETERHNINEGSMACHAMGIAKGCRILRAHDVKASRRVADTMAEILQRRDEVAVR